MHEILGGLGQIPLQVHAVPRVIVQDAQRQRPLPLATRGDHLQRAVMEIEVPQRPRTQPRNCGFRAARAACAASSSPGCFFGFRRGLRTRPWATMYRRSVE